jgi:transitional endoplasmic reticulum ATPase
MIGSTNHLNRLDPAISKRPSRFDRKYYFRIPNRTMRVAYAEYWRKKLESNMDIEFPVDISPLIADLTEGFSFAYLKELFVMSLLTVARGGNGTEDTAENGWDVVSETVTPAEPADGEAGKGDEKAETKEKKKPREVPVIEVAEHLKENVLLKVIQQQVKVLLHEMDNTEEEDKPLPLLSGDGSNDSKDNKPACSTCG